jgi:hypothetical protein
MEIIKHLFGFCGEPHINLITIILGTPTLLYITYYLKWFK